VTDRPLDPRDDPSELTLAEAALLLASGRGTAGRRLQQAVESQLARRDVLDADRDDVRADVAFALLVSPRTGRIALDAACAHVAIVARNKAVDHHRRRRRELPDSAIAPHVALPVAGPLARDLDAVSGEVHRRDVSRALVGMMRGLPASERLALTATATGTGHAGSGLGRSSHYRALDRARLRLTAAVRSRVAAGLALPALLLRSGGSGRGLLAPLGTLLAAGAASFALVLPAVELPRPARAVTTVPARLTRAADSVPVRRLIAPPRIAHVRVRVRVIAAVRVVRSHPARHARARARPVVTHVARTPDAGLGPCRAAHLCQ
jgi:hypothetical protein